MNVLLSAGEVSGDIVGALIADELLRRDPATRLWGLGGPRMSAGGVAVIAETNHLGRVGVSESFSAIAPLLRAFAAVRREVRRARPDAAIVVANDIFNVILGRWLRAQGIPTLAVFPPQVWIWRSLLRFFRGSWDVVAASFPEELRIYQRHLRTVFIGHYLADQLRPASAAERESAREALALRGRVVGLLPGSRIHELRILVPLLLDSASMLLKDDPSMQFVVALAETASEQDVVRQIEARGLGTHVRIVRDSHAAMRASDLLLVASGTATLEAALLGTPMIVLYRVQRLTVTIVRMAIRLGLMDSETLALPNLILGESVVPEIRQEQLVAGRVAAAATALFEDRARLAAMREAMSRVGAAVNGDGSVGRICDLVEELAAPGVAVCEDLTSVALEGGSA
jgi:lipid-A-disaccharide synthase